MRKIMKKTSALALSLTIAAVSLPVGVGGGTLFSNTAIVASADYASPYASLVNNANAVVTFNNMEWYIIQDNSTAKNEGTVTLLLKNPIAAMPFLENGPTECRNDSDVYKYSTSTLKVYLDGLTDVGGLFAEVADVIAPTDLTDLTNETVSGAKIYPPSSELLGLSADILKCETANGSNDGLWWRRTKGNWGTSAGAVNGVYGENWKDLAVGFSAGVRPALRLDLSKVVFESGTNEFYKNPQLTTASLTLGDDLGLNFYISGLSSADGYTVKFTGKCVQNGQTVPVVEKNGKFYATANVYAKDMDAEITAVLYKGENEVSRIENYSVKKYLSALEETLTENDQNYAKTMTLIKATEAFGAASGEYFYAKDYGFADLLADGLDFAGINEDVLLRTAKSGVNAFNTPDTLISLVLDSNTAIRVYIKGVAAGTTASLGENGSITAIASSSEKTAMGYPSYFEIKGLDPKQFADKQTITLNDKEYSFNALSWANRVVRNYENNSASVAVKDIQMAKAVTAYYLAAADYTQPVANIVNLGELTADYTAKNGDILTGALAGKYKITVADGAAITLRDVSINADGAFTDGQFAGITPLGNATITLEGENMVKGFDSWYPGIYAAVDKTLTINGDGKLNASSNVEDGGFGCGIGGGVGIQCGNIVIESGDITAAGGIYAAGIGSGNRSSCGAITISGGTVTATGGDSGAGIGSGYDNAECGNITISGGTVTATGGLCGAGIGSGNTSSCGTITISDGTVTATGGDSGAGIGSGYDNAKCGNITISGGTVTATGGSYAAGIGSGYTQSTCEIITISGGTVTATGGDAGVGIGTGGNISKCGNVIIKNTVTSVTANAGTRCYNSIGAVDESCDCGTITIGDSIAGTQTANPFIYPQPTTSNEP